MMMMYTYDELDTIELALEGVIYDAEGFTFTDPDETRPNEEFLRETRKLLDRIREQKRYQRYFTAPVMGLFLFLFL